jgi:hypothetical protein
MPLPSRIQNRSDREFSVPLLALFSVYEIGPFKTRRRGQCIPAITSITNRHPSTQTPLTKRTYPPKVRAEKCRLSGSTGRRMRSTRLR